MSPIPISTLPCWLTTSLLPFSHISALSVLCSKTRGDPDYGAFFFFFGAICHFHLESFAKSNPFSLYKHLFAGIVSGTDGFPIAFA